MLAIIAGLVLFYAISAGMLWAAEAAGHPHDYPLGIKPDLAAIAAISAPTRGSRRT